MKFHCSSKKHGGIYKILNLVNGNFYIGSAQIFYNRFRVHKSMLLKGTHDNDHLQKSFIKYGADSFSFEEIEIVSDLSQILLREQFYLDQFINDKQCYNMNSVADSISHLNQRWKRNFELIDPNGKKKKFTNVTVPDLARLINQKYSHQVTATGLHALISGKNLSHKGWRKLEHANYDYKHPNRTHRNYKYKTYNVKLVSPDGIVYGPITNLYEFCRNHRIDNPSLLVNLIAGRTNYINGWYLFSPNGKPSEKNSKTYNVKLRSPGGMIFGPISNLTKFAKEHNVNITGLQVLIKGGKTNYKGWLLI